MVTAGQVKKSVRDFNNHGTDLLRSDFNTFDDTLAVFLHFCETDPVLSSIHMQLQALAERHFEEWYQGLDSGSMAGGCKLKFPTDPELRVSVMYELLRRVQDDSIPFTDFAIRFFALGTAEMTAYVRAFNDAVSRPLIRELSHRLSDLSESLPSNHSASVAPASLQIIHQATNVIQQSAVGSGIRQSAIQACNPDLVRLFEELRRTVEETEECQNRLEEYLEYVAAAKELATAQKPKPSAVKALLSSLPSVAAVTSIVASILEMLG